MHIEHIALWTRNLEASKRFYERYFGATAGAKYHNPKRQFQSYFLTFANGARLELMEVPQLETRSTAMRVGWAHIAISLGSREQVDTLTETLRQAGVTIAGEPRVTGDGYYESVVLDPDGNQIELTV
jgi:lactoylglutathione lyase